MLQIDFGLYRPMRHVCMHMFACTWLYDVISEAMLASEVTIIHMVYMFDGL